MTERTRVPSRQSSLADLRFSPGDDTKPPLLTVAIGPKPEPRKETMPVNLTPIPAVDNATIRARIEAGEDLHAVATALGVNYARVRAVKAAMERAKKRAAPPVPQAAADAQEAEDADALWQAFRTRLEACLAADNAFTAYQEASARTMHGADLANYALGLMGEAGEAVEVVKKHLYHGHPLDTAALSAELGDLLWYVAALATTAHLRLADIAEANRRKVQARYPTGFDPARSQHREDTP